MKKLIYVVCGIAFFAVASLIGLVLYLVTKSEVDKNRSKTEAARKARWERKDIDLTGKSEEEINKALDQLNEKKNDENQS